MKKFLSLALTATLLLSLVGCSSSLKAYTPVYGDKLQVNTKLEYKQEYQKAISPETRKAMAEYLTVMADFYNSVDPAQEQSMYFTYLMYTVSNNFISQMEVLAQPLLVKLDNGETLTAEEQLFWDALTQVNAIPVKISEIDSAALKAAQEKAGQEAVDGDKTASSSSNTSSSSETASSSDSSSSSEVASNSDTSSSSNSSSQAPEVKLSIDGAQWEELFNLYVKTFNLLFNEPFAK